MAPAPVSISLLPFSFSSLERGCRDSGESNRLGKKMENDTGARV